MSRFASFLIASLLAAGLMLPTAALAQTYSWTDEDGNVHYGDSIPPEYRDQEQRVLRDGREVDRVERALTAEERAELERKRQMDEEAERVAELEAKRDRRLLSMYSSAAEIERLRDDRLDGLQSQIRLTASNLDDLENNMERVEESIERYEERDEDPPEHLLNRYEDLARQVNDHQRHLMEREEQYEQVKARFEEEIKRFIELAEQD